MAAGLPLAPHRTLASSPLPGEKAYLEKEKKKKDFQQLTFGRPQ